MITIHRTTLEEECVATETRTIEPSRDERPDTLVGNPKRVRL